MIPGEDARIDNIACLSLAILFVANFFQPLHRAAVELFGDGDMRHRRDGRGTVPVFRVRWNPDNIPFSYLLDRDSPLLNPTDSERGRLERAPFTAAQS